MKRWKILDFSKWRIYIYICIYERDETRERFHDSSAKKAVRAIKLAKRKKGGKRRPDGQRFA